MLWRRKTWVVWVSTVLLLLSSIMSMAQTPHYKDIPLAQGAGKTPEKLVGKWAQASNSLDDQLLCLDDEHYLGGELDREITIKSNRTFDVTGYEHTIKGIFTKVVLSNVHELAGQVRYVEFNEMVQAHSKPKIEKGYVHFKIMDGRLQLLKTIPRMDVDKRGLLHC